MQIRDLEWHKDKLVLGGSSLKIDTSTINWVEFAGHTLTIVPKYPDTYMVVDCTNGEFGQVQTLWHPPDYCIIGTYPTMMYIDTCGNFIAEDMPVNCNIRISPDKKFRIVECTGGDFVIVGLAIKPIRTTDKIVAQIFETCVLERIEEKNGKITADFGDVQLEMT